MAEPPRVPMPPAETKKGGASAAAVGVGAAALGLLAKGKALPFAVKALSFGKLLLTFGSMFVSIAVCARGSGWAFGVGLVLIILIHELGHGLAMRSAGLASGYPVFIPWFGAMIALKGQPRNALVEAEIAIAGPVAGAVASVATAALYFVTRDRFFLALASSGFLLNLFNLTPLPPLDGGRVAALFSRQAWIPGVAVLAATYYLTRAPMLLLIGALAGFQLLRKPPLRAPAASDAAIAAGDRRNMALRYFGLCGILAAGFYFANRLLTA